MTDCRVAQHFAVMTNERERTHRMEFQSSLVPRVHRPRRQTRDLSAFFGDDALRRFFGIPELPRRPHERITEGRAADSSSTYQVSF